MAGSGPKVRPCALRRVAQVVEHDARLDARELRAPDRSPAMRCRYFDMSSTTATLQHWPARLVPPPRGRDRRADAGGRSATAGDHVVAIARDDDADRHLAVVRGVGRVERAGAGVEAHLAARRARRSSSASAREANAASWRARIHTSSRTLSERTVSAILSRLRLPLSSDSANFAACSAVTFGGIGGSNGSTTASTSTGPGVASASSSTAPHVAGSSTVKPVPPQARANAAKSIGCSSQPYSGLPRNTICSHLIMPSELFLTTTTLIGSLYLHAVGELRHQHREAAVADEGDALASG